MMPLWNLHEQACAIGCAGLRLKGRVPASFIIPLADDQFGVILAPWKSPEDKYITVDAMREVMKDKGITAYAFITEAWMATINLRTQRELVNVPARERSDREDVLLVMSRSRDGESYMTKYTVHYHVDKGPTLGDPESMDDEIQSGYMNNLFEEPTA